MTSTQPRLTNLRAILFDLDGTLLNSFPTHLKAFKKTFVSFDIELSEAEFREIYSPDWTRVYKAAGLPEADWPLADAIWLEAAANERPALFPGVPETLGLLQTGYDLALVTAGSKRRVLHDLQRTGIDPFFKAVVTGNDVRAPKPSPEGLLRALETLGVSPGDALYVGDTWVDWETARAAGVRFVSVLSEFIKRPTGGEFIQIASVNDLSSLIMPFKTEAGDPPPS